MCASRWIYYLKSHVWWNCFSKIRGRRVNHYDCSQTAGFSRDTLRLGSYHSSPERQNTQIRSLWALSMSRGWRGYHDMKKCLFSGSNHIGYHMVKALQQSSKFLVVCLCEEGRDLHQGRASPLSSVCWNKSCISSGARQQTLSLPAVCHAALLHSTRRLLPWLLSTLSTQPLVFITVPARTAGTAVLWVPTAF